MGIGKQTNLVYLIDFGLSKEFRDSNTHAHIPYNAGHGLIGTMTFASINSHLGLELGRRDDLESLAYILLYFLWGFLPWQSLGRDGQAVLESKRGITAYTLFQELPLELRTFLKYCRSLSFESKPDYEHIHALFEDILLQEACRGHMFDWDVGMEVVEQ